MYWFSALLFGLLACYASFQFGIDRGYDKAMAIRIRDEESED